MLDIDGEYVVVQAVAIAGAKTPPLPSPSGNGNRAVRKVIGCQLKKIQSTI